MLPDPLLHRRLLRLLPPHISHLYSPALAPTPSSPQMHRPIGTPPSPPPAPLTARHTSFGISSCVVDWSPGRLADYRRRWRWIRSRRGSCRRRAGRRLRCLQSQMCRPKGVSGGHQAYYPAFGVKKFFRVPLPDIAAEHPSTCDPFSHIATYYSSCRVSFFFMYHNSTAL